MANFDTTKLRLHKSEFKQIGVTNVAKFGKKLSLTTQVIWILKCGRKNYGDKPNT